MSKTNHEAITPASMEPNYLWAIGYLVIALFIWRIGRFLWIAYRPNPVAETLVKIPDSITTADEFSEWAKRPASTKEIS